MGWAASQQKWGKGVGTLWFHVPVRKLPSCGTQNDTRLHSLVQLYACKKISFQSFKVGTFAGKGLMDPSLFPSATQC